MEEFVSTRFSDVSSSLFQPIIKKKLKADAISRQICQVKGRAWSDRSTGCDIPKEKDKLAIVVSA